MILTLISIGAGFLIISLYWTQISKHEEYASKADKQYAKPVIAAFDRGNIYFESKDGTRVSAAVVNTGFTLYMNPALLTTATETYQALSEYIDLDSEDFMTKAGRTKEKYIPLAKQLTNDTAQLIKKIQLPGIGIAVENWRSYPGDSLAAHALGIVGEDQRSIVVTGRYGLERSYEDVLTRRSSVSNTNLFAQLFGGLNGVFGQSTSKEGDIVTSIEPATQKYLEKMLSETQKLWNPDEIGGIVMDPKTGLIVAMASLPTFDPNMTGEIKNIKVLSNPLVENVYEMGSIMKPLTMATALDTGALTVTSTYDDTGTMTLSGKKISNFDGRARGIVSMQEILSQSLNVGAATIALQVGKDDFARYFFNFGLGDKTKIDLPNEATGLVGNLISGRDIEIATAAYGQGLAVSPVNMAQALSVLANGGFVVTPHLVKEIDYSDGTKEMIKTETKGPYLQRKTVEDVTRMLVNVVEDKIAKAHPTIYWKNYSIAAKTGTAQIPDPVNGGYYGDRYLHSFFGYFPAYDPKFLVFLYQVHPKGAEYASETLTDPFSDIVKFLINYYDVVPDR